MHELALLLKAIVVKIASLPAITDLVGTRIYTTFAPQDIIAPYLVARLLSDNNEGEMTESEYSMVVDIDVFDRKERGDVNVLTIVDALATAFDRVELSESTGNWASFTVHRAPLVADEDVVHGVCSLRILEK